MKKILTFGLTLALILGLATVSLASTVYMDVWNGGKAEQSYFSNTADVSQIALGFDIPMDEFKLSCNLTTGTIDAYYRDDDYYDADTSSIFLKGGYALINDRQLRVDVTAGFYDRILTFDHFDNFEDSYYSLMLGLDAKLKLDNNAWIDFSYAYGITPQGENSFLDELYPFNVDSISFLSCKFNYLLTRELGVSLGYSYEQISFDGFYDKEEFTSGLTIGAFLRF
jgi:hypothetical protein